MTTTITATESGLTTTPDVMTRYEVGLASQNIIHDVSGGGNVAVSLIEPRPRSGTLELVYKDEASARAAFEMHGLAEAFELSDTDIPRAAMTYVIDGNLSLVLDAATRSVWLLTVGFQEVKP